MWSPPSRWSQSPRCSPVSPSSREPLNLLQIEGHPRDQRSRHGVQILLLQLAVGEETKVLHPVMNAPNPRLSAHSQASTTILWAHMPTQRLLLALLQRILEELDLLVLLIHPPRSCRGRGGHMGRPLERQHARRRLARTTRDELLSGRTRHAVPDDCPSERRDVTRHEGFRCLYIQAPRSALLVVVPEDVGWSTAVAVVALTSCPLVVVGQAQMPLSSAGSGLGCSKSVLWSVLPPAPSASDVESPLCRPSSPPRASELQPSPARPSTAEDLLGDQVVLVAAIVASPPIVVEASSSRPPWPAESSFGHSCWWSLAVHECRPRPRWRPDVVPASVACWCTPSCSPGWTWAWPPRTISSAMIRVPPCPCLAGSNRRPKTLKGVEEAGPSGKASGLSIRESPSSAIDSSEPCEDTSASIAELAVREVRMGQRWASPRQWSALRSLEFELLGEWPTMQASFSATSSMLTLLSFRSNHWTFDSTWTSQTFALPTPLHDIVDNFGHWDKGVGRKQMEECPASSLERRTHRSCDNSWNFTRFAKKSCTAPKPSKTSLPNKQPSEWHGTFEIQTSTALPPSRNGNLTRSWLTKVPPFPNLKRSCSGSILMSCLIYFGAHRRASSVWFIHREPAHDRLHALSKAAWYNLSSLSEVFGETLKASKTSDSLEVTMHSCSIVFTSKTSFSSVPNITWEPAKRSTTFTSEMWASPAGFGFGFKADCNFPGEERYDVDFEGAPGHCGSPFQWPFWPHVKQVPVALFGFGRSLEVPGLLTLRPGPLNPLSFLIVAICVLASSTAPSSCSSKASNSSVSHPSWAACSSSAAMTSISSSRPWSPSAISSVSSASPVLNLLDLVLRRHLRILRNLLHLSHIDRRSTKPHACRVPWPSRWSTTRSRGRWRRWRSPPRLQSLPRLVGELLDCWSRRRRWRLRSNSMDPFEKSYCFSFSVCMGLHNSWQCRLQKLFLHFCQVQFLLEEPGSLSIIQGYILCLHLRHQVAVPQGEVGHRFRWSSPRPQVKLFSQFSPAVAHCPPNHLIPGVQDLHDPDVVDCRWYLNDLTRVHISCFHGLCVCQFIRLEFQDFQGSQLCCTLLLHGKPCSQVEVLRPLQVNGWKPPTTNARYVGTLEGCLHGHPRLEWRRQSQIRSSHQHNFGLHWQTLHRARKTNHLVLVHFQAVEQDVQLVEGVHDMLSPNLKRMSTKHYYKARPWRRCRPRATLKREVAQREGDVHHADNQQRPKDQADGSTQQPTSDAAVCCPCSPLHGAPLPLRNLDGSKPWKWAPQSRNPFPHGLISSSAEWSKKRRGWHGVQPAVKGHRSNSYDFTICGMTVWPIPQSRIPKRPQSSSIPACCPSFISSSHIECSQFSSCAKSFPRIPLSASLVDALVDVYMDSASHPLASCDTGGFRQK